MQRRDRTPRDGEQSEGKHIKDMQERLPCKKKAMGQSSMTDKNTSKDRPLMT